MTPTQPRFEIGQRARVADRVTGEQLNGTISHFYPAEEAHVDQGVSIDACGAWVRVVLDEGSPIPCDLDQLELIEGRVGTLWPSEAAE